MVGTQVHVSLKMNCLQPIQAADEPCRCARTAPVLNVLVVDDHPANRLLMCQQLGYLGHQFTAAQPWRRRVPRPGARHTSTW